MRYRRLGKTNLSVSEIGLGAEWLERHNEQECREIITFCEEEGINIMDCWMANPNVRSNIGNAIKDTRDKWYIQGHVGSTWQDGQYVRTRDIEKVKVAFDDLLTRLHTDYIDLGMIHYVDEAKDYDTALNTEYIDYVYELKRTGVIKHTGLSTHNPKIALRAIKEGFVENIMFSINPAFDLQPASEDINTLFAEEYDSALSGIDPDREELYRLCEKEDIGITVMKGYGGGRLFEAEKSPFGIALTPVQCIHYALTRPGVASFMAGFDCIDHVKEAVHYEYASDEEKDYASVLAKAPRHAFADRCTYCGHCQPCPVRIDIAMVNKYYDLATMQPEVPDGVAGHYRDMEAHASDCIECGGCEERCPFGVNVTENMKRASELFGI